MTRVILVRPWRAARTPDGCCAAGADAVRLDAENGSAPPSPEAGLIPMIYRRLRSRVPAADVQIVSASNTVYLLPSTYRACRERVGRVAALREALRSTTAGAVIVDGEVIGSVDVLDADDIERACADRVRPASRSTNRGRARSTDAT